MTSNFYFLNKAFKRIFGKILCALFAILMTGSVQQGHAQNFVIGGVSYIACSPSETVVAPFTTTAGGVTTNLYSSLVLIKVSGTGQASGTSLNDAFYFNLPENPTQDPNISLLVITTGASVFEAPVNPNTATRHIVYDVDAGTAVTPPYVPAFRADNTYTFVINMNTLVPAPTGPAMLRFGVNDLFTIDNSGAYTVQVTQLCEGCGKNGDKALICHNGNEICVSQSAVKSHIGHGDVFGHCPLASIQSGSETRRETVETDGVLPDKLQVSVSPNPALNSTRIFYELPFDGHVVIKVYDLLGKEIATLVNADSRAGYYSKEFNVSTLQKGLYFYRTTVKTKSKVWVQTGKINVVK
ncbi:T9SS type A sorting domain-containing protein [Niastella caeni]|uniref:T9SS type A sorting domain-containing protein n=1 Tax=Niastella caeni TaxID=2569763 RepID=UPI00140D6033|nr:T9SS type A sorting domain-containing protein [Niastella caeni]